MLCTPLRRDLRQKVFFLRRNRVQDTEMGVLDRGGYGDGDGWMSVYSTAEVFRVLRMVRMLFIYMGNDSTIHSFTKYYAPTSLHDSMLRDRVLLFGPKQSSRKRLEVPTAIFRAVRC